jgi:hypothetical protein
MSDSDSQSQDPASQPDIHRETLMSFGAMEKLLWPYQCLKRRHDMSARAVTNQGSWSKGEADDKGSYTR